MQDQSLTPPLPVLSSYPSQSASCRPWKTQTQREKENPEDVSKVVFQLFTHVYTHAYAQLYRRSHEHTGHTHRHTHTCTLQHFILEIWKVPDSVFSCRAVVITTGPGAVCRPCLRRSHNTESDNGECGCHYCVDGDTRTKEAFLRNAGREGLIMILMDSR